MKAYYLTTTDEEEGAVVFATSVREAKKKIFSTDIYFDSWIQVRARRDKRYDNLEKLSPSEFALLQWKDGWRWDADYPDPDEATDAEFIDWYERTFNMLTKINKD